MIPNYSAGKDLAVDFAVTCPLQSAYLHKQQMPAFMPAIQCSLTYKNILYKNIVRRFGEKNEDAFRQLFLKSMYASGEVGYNNGFLHLAIMLTI